MPAIHRCTVPSRLRVASAKRRRFPDFGQRWGRPRCSISRARPTRIPPRLKAFDGKGFRRDLVEFHPAYHHFMAESTAAGLHASTWQGNMAPAAAPAQVTARGTLLHGGAGRDRAPLPDHHDPRRGRVMVVEPTLVAELAPNILSRTYDPRFLPASRQAGVTLGMGMTEKQGGSDVRANTTRAEPPAGRAYRIVGHKWFFSAPMCDAFLILAQAPNGLSCFLLPRFTPDGNVNATRIQRLKDKLGDRSNASSEVEFDDAHAELVGEEGRGIATILAMGTYAPRLRARHRRPHAQRAVAGDAPRAAPPRVRQRSGRRAADAHVLADLALESEAATALAMRLARAFDEPDEPRAALARVVTPAAKFWVCKRGPAVAAEAMEVSAATATSRRARCARLYRADAAQLDLGRLRATSCASTCCARSVTRGSGAHHARRTRGRCGRPPGRARRRGLRPIGVVGR